VANNARSGALVAAAVTAVTVQAWQYGVNVINRTAGQEIWVRLDGTDPTVGGNDCFLVLGARNFPVDLKAGTLTVKLISSGTPNYTVEGQVPLS
jgi:hypothetical protein